MQHLICVVFINLAHYYGKRLCQPCTLSTRDFAPSSSGQEAEAVVQPAREDSSDARSEREEGCQSPERLPQPHQTSQGEANDLAGEVRMFLWSSWREFYGMHCVVRMLIMCMYGVLCVCLHVLVCMCTWSGHFCKCCSYCKFVT